MVLQRIVFFCQVSKVHWLWTLHQTMKPQWLQKKTENKIQSSDPFSFCGVGRWRCPKLVEREVLSAAKYFLLLGIIWKILPCAYVKIESSSFHEPVNPGQRTRQFCARAIATVWSALCSQRHTRQRTPDHSSVLSLTFAIPSAAPIGKRQELGWSVSIRTRSRHFSDFATETWSTEIILVP